MMLLSVTCLFLVNHISATRFCSHGLCTLVHIEIDVQLHRKANNDLWIIALLCHWVNQSAGVMFCSLCNGPV